jgi:pimeloyl-ACP methyl ester carboxylesterase
MSQYFKEEGKYKYIETNGGEEVLLLLHGLFGELSNFEGIINEFKDSYNVVVPILPIFEIPFKELNLGSLVEAVEEFTALKGFQRYHVLGNSLGGHIAILYTLKNPDKVASITLTGSSGLFEDSLGNTFPPRGNYEFVKTKTESTFYDPSIATKEMVDEVYSVVNDRSKTLSIIATARSAIKNNLEDRLHDIKCPTLLVWGKQDTITPPFVGEKFKELIPHANLHFIDKCGHAAMMEKPAEFNKLLAGFLKGTN